MLSFIPSDKNAESFRSANSIEANTKFGIERGFFRLGKDLLSTFRSEIRKKKTGKLYRVPGRSRSVRASSQGESPATRTGNYRRSVGFKVSGTNLIFGNSAKYAGYLETGTTRMDARPGLGNAIKASQRDALVAISKGIKDKI